MTIDCGPSCSLDGDFYVYRPNLGANVTLLALFALLLPVVLFLGVHYRTPGFSATLAAGILVEILGFAGRILLHGARGHEAFFALSLFGTVLGPTCTSAALVLVLAHVFTIYGERFAPCRPMLASLVLHGLVAAALAVQVVGIGLLSRNFHSLASSSILAAGLALQTIALLGMIGLYLRFVFGLHIGQQFLDLKHSSIYRTTVFARFRRGFELAAILVLIYSIVRLAEMAGGPASTLFQSQAGFMVVDGVIPLIACLLLTIFHPGAAFGPAWGPTSVRGKKRRAPPAPLKHPKGYNAHHRYDPDIKKHISPTSQRLLPASPPPDIPEGSPGLPSNPRPAHKPLSPKMHSPTSIRTFSSKRSSRSERKVVPQQKMVDTSNLW